jgi:hypothetical protein
MCELKLQGDPRPFFVHPYVSKELLTGLDIRRQVMAGLDD